MSQEEEEAAKLPLLDRAVHKIWKIRKQAYEELSGQFQNASGPQDECFLTIDTETLRKMTVDANMAALDSATQAVAAYIQHAAPDQAVRVRSAVIPGIVEKGLCSNRQGTKEPALACLVSFVEQDTLDPVIEIVTNYYEHKVPKVIVGSLVATNELISSFGPTRSATKVLIPKIPKLLGHADKNVRAETLKMAVELYKWFGASVGTPILADVKTFHKKELEEKFQEISQVQQPPQATRFNRADREAQAMEIDGDGDAGGATGSKEGEYNGAVEDEDENEFVEAVAVMPRIPDTFWVLIGSTIWKERKEALEELTKAVDVPKMVNEDVTRLVQTLCKCISKDANIACAALAAGCMESLGKGLGRNFGEQNLNAAVPALLDRTKDKKISDVIRSALDVIFRTTDFTLSKVTPITTSTYMTHKTPQIRIDATQFMVRCFANMPRVNSIDEFVPAIEVGVKLLDDTSGAVRAAAQEMLGVAKKIAGDQPLRKWLQNIPEIKMKQINQFCENATVRAKLKASDVTVKQAAGTANPRMVKATTNNNLRMAKAGGVARAGTGTGTNALPTKPVERAATKQALHSTPVKPPPATRRRLASPEKARPQSLMQSLTSMRLDTGSGFDQYEDGHVSPPLDEFDTAEPPVIDRRLTRRVLRPDKESNEQVEQLKAQKMELYRDYEKLRMEYKDSENQRANLERELNRAQLHISQVTNESTQLNMKLKNQANDSTQARIEIDGYRDRVRQLELELERVREQARLAVCSRCSTGDVSGANIDSAGMRQLQIGRASSFKRSSPNKLNLQFGLEPRVRSGEGQSSQIRSPPVGSCSPSGFSASARPLSRGSSSSSSTSQQGSREQSSMLSDTQKDWKRAAAVTSELRARIDAMRQARTAT